ncbi:MAG TPA: cytochrome c3 family protein [Candidatus Aminicenantes bacterium]|nr:cytochrome c3 family protein [Candidatus Aminicenantes bacterium]HRY65399.1 cytochrome c3 family protein [Candidatus Aminicenantes bacterium]HRZ72133.1 cytochrome c3 family protein [Candidatus Aminicenantes bacterium]
MPERRRTAAALLLLALALCLGACSTKDEMTAVDIPATSMSYVVLAWSAEGMHFLNSTYGAEVLSVPYNTLRAQVIRRGDPPQIVTSGVTVEYSIVNNASSYSKASTDPVRSFAQFWDNSLGLFGVDLAHDTGLNLVDPGVNNGLTGTMLLKDTHFQADGIPVVPIDDDDVWDPYQVAEVVVKDSSTGVELTRTRATVETSDEINCTKCHGQTIDDEEIGSVLQSHDDAEETTFVDDGQPVLCASCHDSLALGRTGSTTAEETMSYAIHIYHYAEDIACYDCHPGDDTDGNRSTAHTSSDGECTNCHGSLTSLAATIAAGRVPWATEPKCVDCHTFVAEVDTGTALYRDGVGHGGLSCPACHGPAHAQVPSNKDSDNYQALQYQAKALALGSCKVCHENSKGGGLNGIVTAHGGTRPTSCNVCHTGPITTTNPYNYPHRFQARRR